MRCEKSSPGANGRGRTRPRVLLRSSYYSLAATARHSPCACLRKQTPALRAVALCVNYSLARWLSAGPAANVSRVSGANEADIVALVNR